MKKATREEVEALEWTEEALSCRSYGHQWRRSTATRYGNVFEVVQRCNSCGGTRKAVVDSDGYAEPWKYGYVEGYLLKGMGRLDESGKAALRIRSILAGPIEEGETDGS